MHIFYITTLFKAEHLQSCSKLFLLACLAISVSVARGQSDSLQFMNQFEDGQVQWRLRETRIIMNDACENGEYMTFFAEKKTMVQKTCDTERGRWNNRSLGWQILREDGQWKIIIGEASYTMRIKKEKNMQVMILDKLPATRYEKVVRKKYVLN